MDTKGYIHCQHGIAVMRSGLETADGQRPLMEMIDPYPCSELGCRATFRKAMNTPVDGVPFSAQLGWRDELAQQREEIPQKLLEAAAHGLLAKADPSGQSLANAVEVVRPIVQATLLRLAEYAEQITLLSCDRTSGPSLRILAERVEGAEL